MKKIVILGTRGIPARHGGFETFVESLAPYLVKEKFDVTVYCQLDRESIMPESLWNGVRLVSIRPKALGALATLEFDFKSICQSLREKPDLALVFGYNTAALCFLLKLGRVPIFMNMDGVEWKRKKWNIFFKVWLWLNEKIGCWISDYLIADHSEIQKRLEKFVSAKKINLIPYGADVIERANIKLLSQFSGLLPYEYAVFIGRPEPENHILEIVKAFSGERRGFKLVVLGDYVAEMSAFKKAVVRAASSEVVFAGPIYDVQIVEAFLFYSKIYLHGHSVGGTNPSLIQAMAAGCRIVAHDNPFNRGTLGGAGEFFKTEEELKNLLRQIGPGGKRQRQSFPGLSSLLESTFQYKCLIESIK